VNQAERYSDPSNYSDTPPPTPRYDARMNMPSAQSANVQPVKTHRDARGALFEPLTDAELAAQKNVHVVLTQPNEVRGNHVHRTAVETTSVVGPCLIRLKEAGVIRDLEVPEGEIWRLTIPPGVVHAFRNTGETVMVLVSFSTNLHDPAGSDTVREAIL
jgi:dTDP-4-dehydrorhamnose 3,5-epimerase-like enzyme